jgi:two-component system phosphate regulon sensor histidine kinase PhoR
VSPEADAEASTARLLRALVDEAVEPLFALDEYGRILEANSAAARFLARDRRDLRGTPLVAFVSLADRRAFRTAIAGLEAGRTTMLELSLGPPNNCSSRPLSLRRAPAQPPLIVAAVARRSAAVRRESATAGAAAAATAGAAAETRLDALLARLPIGVVALRADGTVVFANATAVRHLGPLRRGRPLPALRRDSPLRAHVRRLLDRASSLPPRLVEFESGKIVRVLGVGPREDVPALLVVDDMTGLLRQNEAQQAFVRNAAHQLRTPLAGIAGAIEALQGGAKDDPAARERFLDHVADETQRLTRIVRALLVLARAQSGDEAPALEFVPVRPLLDEVAASLHVHPGVRVEVRAPATLAALCEPELLHEALAALAENAARHTREGAVEFCARETDDHVLEVEVRDSGDGIPPEHTARIFDPFYRATPDGGGFGLGLAIAKQAVEAMGAKLDVDSSPGTGTRFVVRLPSARVVG